MRYYRTRVAIRTLHWLIVSIANSFGYAFFASLAAFIALQALAGVEIALLTWFAVAFCIPMSFATLRRALFTARCARFARRVNATWFEVTAAAMFYPLKHEDFATPGAFRAALNYIHPDDIDTSRHFYGAFGCQEHALGANLIVQLCQQRGNWNTFSINELEELYRRNGFRNFKFNGLDTDGWVAVEDGECAVNKRFIAACYDASPVRQGLLASSQQDRSPRRRHVCGAS